MGAETESRAKGGEIRDGQEEGPGKRTSEVWRDSRLLISDARDEQSEKR